MQTKIGLVFAGGGGKGAYQVGVWKALAELGIARQVEVVSGTSVGALNAALFAQGDYARAEDAWLGMVSGDVLQLTYDKIKEHAKTLVSNTLLHQHQDTVAYLLKSGVFSRDGLARMIDRSLGQRALKDTPIRCFANCSKLGFPRLYRAEYIPLHGKELPQVRPVLLASSAIPVVFGLEKLDTGTYWDGFLSDNLPVRPVYDTGCDVIFAVMLERSTRLDPKQFPNATLIPIAPSEHPGSALHFEGVRGKMEHGYRDAWEALSGAVRQNALRQRGRELMEQFLMAQAAHAESRQRIDENQVDIDANTAEIDALAEEFRQLVTNKR